MASNDNNPQVTPSQPQTDAALKIKDPSSIDDTAIYHYDLTNAGFTIGGYSTFVQDVQTPEAPAVFSDPKYAPTTSPFILEVQGTGFDISTAKEAPLNVWILLGGFIAQVPPLPSSTNLKVGNAFGYVVKSATKLWIYCKRLTFQEIWSAYDVKTFNGTPDAHPVQLESGTSVYPLLGKQNTLTVQIAVNTGISSQVNYFSSDVNNFKSVTVPLTQSPFIITLHGRELNGATYPHVQTNPNGKQPLELIDLYGHNLVSKQVMMVKRTSKLLVLNPSKIPQDIIDKSQSDDVINAMSAQDLANLDYFKTGHFLGELKTYNPAYQIVNYSYRAADYSVKRSGKSGMLPQDPLSIVQFQVKTLPAGSYDVVIYDAKTGDYDVAPVPITINLAAGNLEIHDVTPDPIVLQSPSFTVNGFNFPTTDDINNGATFTVSIVDSDNLQAIWSNPLSALFLGAYLTIDKTSPTQSKNGAGSITLTSDSQFTAKFTNLHVTDAGIDPTFRLYVTVTYEEPNPSLGKINESALSGILHIQSQPVINFLTNTTAPLDNSVSNAYAKSLVRVDQATGKVIAFGKPSDYLYIVGRNFFLQKNTKISVLIKGVQQANPELVTWPDNTYSAIKVKVDPSNIKGDATVEVRIGSASSEAFQYSTKFRPLNSTKNAQGVFTAKEETISSSEFANVLPFNQFDHVSLLNSANTKVSSSVRLTLSNHQTKQSVKVSGDLNSSVALPFLPDQVTIPSNTKLNADGSLDVTFYFSNLYNVNISTPKIFRLYHDDGSYGGVFKPKEVMSVIGTGFVNGMRYNINNTGWQLTGNLFTKLIDSTIYQGFIAYVPDANGATDASIRVSNDQADKVNSIATAGKSSGSYKVNTITVNDRYSPLLKINQRLPAGIKMYAKGPQVSMTDQIDANMSIYGQITPFLGSFKTLLIVIRIIVCIIDVICALINPFQLIVAIIALMDCIIDLLSLFPQLAVPIMILSFLQNFIGFLQTFITQIEAYVFSIVNSQLALVEAQISQDIALLAAAEQQAFGATKQIRDVISFLEPALQIIQIFKDLLAFAMHFPCAGNQGSNQANGTCPPQNVQDMANNSTLKNMVDQVNDLFGQPQSQTLQTMFCQAVALQTTTLQTMPGFNGLDSFGNPLPGGPLAPGSTSVVPVITPVLPNISAAIECMNNFTDQIEAALNAGQTYITTAEQGQALVAAYLQCVQNLIDQTNQALGDTCVLAVSALNSELKVSPKGRIGPDLNDDFIKTVIPLPTTDPNSLQDAGLTLDLAQLNDPSKIPLTIATDPATGAVAPTQNFGTKQDIYTPVIFQSTNKSGQRQSPTTIYFNADNSEVGGLITPGDILEIVGGTFNGLQFPILAIQQIFSAVRLTCKLDITFEQRLLVGEQPLPENLSGFDVKIIAHLAGNDAVAVVPADDSSVATIQILARDHHGHEIGTGLANKVAIKIESGTAEFVPVIPSSTTDVTGVIQESGTHYIANLKANCAGTVILSSSVCGIEFVDIGYHANDPNHAITTRKKTVKIIFTPPIPKPAPSGFDVIDRPQVPGTDFVN